MKALDLKATELLREQDLPQPGEPTWVQCGRYRTLAERDEKGRWWTIAKHEELTGPLKVLGRV